MFSRNRLNTYGLISLEIIQKLGRELHTYLKKGHQFISKIILGHNLANASNFFDIAKEFFYAAKDFVDVAKEIIYVANSGMSGKI